VRSFIAWSPRRAATLVFVFPFVIQSAWAAESIGRTALRCQRAITVAGQAFTARQLSDLARCTTGILSCVENGGGDAECLPRAGTRCERGVNRILRREAKLARTLAVRCEAVDRDVLLGAAGLGFGELAPLCPTLGTDRGDASVLAECLAGLQRCGGERLFTTAVPRAGELLRIASVPRTALTCLADHGGSGHGERDAEAGVAIIRCARSMARAGARLAGRTLANVALCTRATRACLESSEADTACLDDATTTCGGAFVRVDDARRAFGRAVAAACGDERVPFTTLASATGANLAALADECATVQMEDASDLPATIECIVRRHECDLTDLVREATPRADALLALGNQTIAHPFCGAAAPLPTTTATVTPSATFTGPTRTPRPGETATPTPQATPPPPSPTPTATPFCGNDVVDDGEECDGGNFEDNTCDDLCFESDPNGTLSCNADCTIDFTGCHGEDCEAP